MSTLVLVEAKVKDGSADALEALMTKILPDTRSYDGCERITVNFDEARGTIVLIENWGSETQYQKYLDWRKETGVLDEIVSHLAEPPSIRFFGESSA